MSDRVLRDLNPKILILTLAHGAAHRRAAEAIEKALTRLDPSLIVRVADALAHCAAWFRAYYNSYEIPLRYCPELWRWIEAAQHRSRSTGPAWLYRQGAKPLFRFIESFDPGTVVVTEVGLCELVSLYKRERPAAFRLVAVELMDFYPAWVQAEVDLYLTSHPDLSAELAAAGASPEKIVCSGQPIDPVFLSLPTREEARARLGVAAEVPLLLVLFGGGGYGNPLRLVPQLQRISLPLQTVLIAGKNRRLEDQLRQLCHGLARSQVFGWVANLHEWMTAADLVLSKPGGNTLAETFACGVPMLAFDPLPGNEERTCRWIENWQAGLWIRQAEGLVPTIEALLANPDALVSLRRRAQALARPCAAYGAAAAINKLALTPRSNLS
jgi:processive 1,2-diacylglycerol beta-glucosyltransferase